MEVWAKKRRPLFYEGLHSMNYTVNQIERIYKDIYPKYPNATIFTPYRKIHIPVVNHLIIVIGDRGIHGLENMEQQFLGKNIISDEAIPDLVERNTILNPDSIFTHLVKNFPYMRLIMYIYGAAQLYKITGDCMSAYPLYLDSAFKAFRIPISAREILYEHFINAPARYAISYEHIYLGFPDEVVKPLKEGKFGDFFFVFPGNGIAPIGSPVEGVKKDLEYGYKNPVEPNAKYLDLVLTLREYRIYFFRGGKKG